VILAFERLLREDKMGKGAKSKKNIREWGKKFYSGMKKKEPPRACIDPEVRKESNNVRAYK
jgi:hypothetical protein